LVEPATCEYLLGVESPWFCNTIENADENGVPTTLNVDNEDNLN
jgi:hypothetical protein